MIRRIPLAHRRRGDRGTCPGEENGGSVLQPKEMTYGNYLVVRMLRGRFVPPPAKRDGSFIVWDVTSGGGAYGRLIVTKISQPCAGTGLECLTRWVSRPVPHTEEHWFAMPGVGTVRGVEIQVVFLLEGPGCDVYVGHG